MPRSVRAVVVLTVALCLAALLTDGTLRYVLGAAGVVAVVAAIVLLLAPCRGSVR